MYDEPHRLRTRTFHDDLALSHSNTVTTFWRTAHQRAFKTFQRMEPECVLENQKKGIDRYVFTDTRVITVEEKCDWTQHQNLPFELDDINGNKGWANKTIAAEVFAYGFIEQRIVYYFPTSAFQSVFHKHKQEWIQQFGQRTVWCSNAQVCPVPLSLLCMKLPHQKLAL